MSAPDDVAVDQLHLTLVGLAKTLGIDPDAPDAVAQFAAALLRLIPLQSPSPPKSRRKPTWRAGLYAELYQDVNQTKARLNCSYKDAIAHLREDRSGPWLFLPAGIYRCHCDKRGIHNCVNLLCICGRYFLNRSYLVS